MTISLSPLLRGITVLHGNGMALVRHLSLDVVASLEYTVLFGGFIDVHSHFFAAHVLKHIKGTIDLQQIPIDGLWPGGHGGICHMAVCHGERVALIGHLYFYLISGLNDAV